MATATTRCGDMGSAPWGGGITYHPGEHELSPEWIHALRDAGRQTYSLHPDGALSDQIYGYQALAPLLNHGTFDEYFLQIVGGDMIDFEIELGGSSAWAKATHDLTDVPGRGRLAEPAVPP